MSVLLQRNDPLAVRVPPQARQVLPGQVIACVALAAALILVLPGIVQAQSAPKVTVDKNLEVAMRDGVHLATDVYRPTPNGTVPAILVRTPYGKDSVSDEGTFFAEHGYAYVVQDTRGRFNSEGNFDIYVQDDADGLDAALWLNAQPWFNQQQGFGVYGASYLASTALSTAEMHPPNLKAAYLAIASANYHDDGAWRGGAFQLAHNVFFSAATVCPNQIERAASATTHSTPKVPLPGGGDPAMFGLESATPLDQRLLSDNCPWYRNWAMNSDANWYWNQLGLNHAAHFDQLPPIPMAFLGGWYDQFLGGTIVDFQGAPLGQPASLTIGPWIHGAMNKPVAGDGFFGQAAGVDQKTEALHWFDRYLKGSGAGDPQPNTVRYFLMGGGTGDHADPGQLNIGGSWQTATAWPPSDIQSVPYYLRADGVLSPDKPRADSPDMFEYDPHNPVPTIGGNISSGSVFAPAGAYAQRCRRDSPACQGRTDELGSRPDVLTYQTDPLDQDLAVVGPLTVELWAATSASDTDFTAKLVDVYPDGEAVNVADGIIRARYRDDATQPNPVTPDSVNKYTIDLWHTAMLFKVGHRVRVDISSSNFPHYDRNLNTGEPIGSDVLDNAMVATQTVFHDATHTSNIVLPIMPRD
ncbi:MAG: CocE/NonD family hydrolase [Chloroflexota bacterium]|nr:CocE/NonD family hydrolase [Chloroflexota bacterium]